ncbi:hypothetical protein [Streptosporangium sp. NPDC000396]|uniref:hypothetical protein n=1 Tax=Streptosporangium sp. NPDC000396 TaxID=3366185 RepID=UPI0036AC8238
MGTWLATVRFPDGTRKYARYSTVVECMYDRLYSTACHYGDMLPDGQQCYRSAVTGEPDPQWPEAKRAPIDQLVPVEIGEEANNCTWHALYCPQRAMVLGPMSCDHMDELQYRYELVRGDDGVRHLCDFVISDAREDRRPNAACGRRVPGQLLPFHRIEPYLGMELDTLPEDLPPMDLYAEWDRDDLCRECLASQLPQ